MFAFRLNGIGTFGTEQIGQDSAKTGNRPAFLAHPKREDGSRLACCRAPNHYNAHSGPLVHRDF